MITVTSSSAGRGATGPTKSLLDLTLTAGKTNGTFTLGIEVNSFAPSTIVTFPPRPEEAKITITPDRVAPPILSPSPCTFTPPMAISITCATPGASIRYTKDETEPTERSDEYTAPLTLTGTTTIMAKGFFKDWTPSDTVIGTYTKDRGPEPAVCVEEDSGKLDIKGGKGAIREEVWIPVRIQAAPWAISTFGFELIYEPAILKYSAYERGGLIASFSNFEVNYLGSGRLRVRGDSSESSIPPGASGYLVWLKFEIVGGQEKECYPLQLENLRDDLVQFPSTGGCFCIHPWCTGDLTGDMNITPADALIAFKCYLGSGPCPDCADINQDDEVTPADALCLFKHYLGQPSCLGEEKITITGKVIGSNVIEGPAGPIRCYVHGMVEAMFAPLSLSRYLGRTITVAGEGWGEALYRAYVVEAEDTGNRDHQKLGSW